MRILVADPRQQKRIAQLLSSLGHVTSCCSTSSDISAAVASSAPPEVAIVSIREPALKQGVSEIVAKSPHIYTIAVVSEVSGAQAKAAYAAGADDVMSSRPSVEELAGRVDAITRIRKWFGSLPAQDEQRLQLESLLAWQTLGDLAGAELSEMLGRPLSAVQVQNAPLLDVAAEVTLTSVEHSLESTLGVGVEAGSGKMLSQAIFGDGAPDGALQDAMREFCNSAGGSFKRSALTEGHTFALNLPADRRQLDVGTETRKFRLADDDVTLYVWISNSAATPLRLKATALREGMVLTQDVRSPAGIVLIQAGSVLTERTVERLARIVGEGALLEVTAKSMVQEQAALPAA